jgi:hypothetical protein
LHIAYEASAVAIKWCGLIAAGNRHIEYIIENAENRKIKLETPTCKFICNM